MNHRRIATLTLVLSLWAISANGDDQPPPSECRWADDTITIDGRADEANWKLAQQFDNFHLPWLQENSRPAKSATKARLLWDHEFLYFFAEMEDGDLFATIKENDGRLWENDVFELFFKPAADKPGYYEFQVNPAGAVLDMFIPRRGSGGYERYYNDGPFHIESKVVLNGTLNKWSDADQGWAVEGRIPWGDFLRTGGRPKVDEIWRFTLCRYDYSVDFEGPELSTIAPMKSKTRPDFHAWEDYARLKFIGPNPKQAARPFGIEQFQPVTTSRVVGAPEPPPPYAAQRAYPDLKISFPIFAVVEPLSGEMIFIEQDRSYTDTRICRTIGGPESGKHEVLMATDGLAYSIAFHPQFKRNGYVYIGSNGPDEESHKKKSTRVMRYQMETKPPHQLVDGSAKEIIKWPSDGHNGGAITFGNDGLLYITSGDGTSDSDVDLKGQGLDHLLAKVLRIDVDNPSGDQAYSVPADNPFVGRDNVRPETWAYGLRNPWRITTDPKSGDIWVGNNGQDLWEQIYLVQRGDNYGWSVYEGSHPFYLNRELGPTPLSRPAAEHHHREARSMTGGVVYHGKALPQLRGMYIYGDYSTGKIWAIRHENGKVTDPWEIADTPFAISGFALDSEGELLVIDHTAEGGFYHLKPREADDSHLAFPRKLSDTGLFEAVAEHRVMPSLIAYSVNSPLWSDGAYKERYIALPSEDSTIEFHPTRSWGFPDGTVMVKSFAVESIKGNPSTRKWIETRLLTRQQGEWVGYSYAWNDQQSDAMLVEGDGRDIEYKVESPSGESQQKQWHFPSRAECMVCHSRAANFVLGVSTPQLNGEHDYHGVKDNQLRTLESLGLFRLDPRADSEKHFRQMILDSGAAEEEADKQVRQVKATRDQRQAIGSSRLLAKPPTAYDKLADPYDANADLAARARSYLHVNCASCHISAGGGNAQIDLAYTRDLQETKSVDNKPLHHTFGIENPQIIAAGKPGHSVLLHRLKIRGTGQMPPLATYETDQRAVELMREWIQSIEPNQEAAQE